MDRIIIKGLTLNAHHGVLQDEKDNGQTFILDITASLDLTDARKSDDLNGLYIH
jgi:FolB domain-containing protein